MKTSYKFWYIRRHDSGLIEECCVRFYEGEVNTKNEEALDHSMVPVTRYRRSKLLKEVDLPHLAGKFMKDAAGNDCVIFTSDDFGVITDDDELRVFLNKEMKKDVNRTSNIVQSETSLAKLRKLKIK